MSKKKKRIAKSKAKKRQKRKSKKAEKIKFSTKIIHKPAITEIEPPKGFRPVSITQAILEYSKPFDEKLGEKTEDNFKLVMDLGMNMWNFTEARISYEEKSVLKVKIILSLVNNLKMKKNEANDFFDKMVERKEYLFPQSIQSEDTMMFFIRKEDMVFIPDFDYSQIKISKIPIPADEKDQDCIKSILFIDAQINQGADYLKWEKKYFQMCDKCKDRFIKWMEDKGVKKLVQDMAFNIDFFLKFIYTYRHEEEFTLRFLPALALNEFFGDFLIRKMLVKPHEYTYYIPSIKLFYEFLADKNYINDSQTYIAQLDEIEPQFMKILREHF